MMRMVTDNVIVQRENLKIVTRVMGEGTKINMFFGDTVIPRTLNDSETAQALIKMLPYTVQLSNYGNDFCGVMADSL